MRSAGTGCPPYRDSFQLNSDCRDVTRTVMTESDIGLSLSAIRIVSHSYRNLALP